MIFPAATAGCKPSVAPGVFLLEYRKSLSAFSPLFEKSPFGAVPAGESLFFYLSRTGSRDSGRPGEHGRNGRSRMKPKGKLESIPGKKSGQLVKFDRPAPTNCPQAGQKRKWGVHW
jgi:hypothetical protein